MTILELALVLALALALALLEAAEIDLELSGVTALRCTKKLTQLEKHTYVMEISAGTKRRHNKGSRKNTDTRLWISWMRRTRRQAQRQILQPSSDELVENRACAHLHTLDASAKGLNNLHRHRPSPVEPQLLEQAHHDPVQHRNSSH
jgi:hypothetical protein